MQATGAFVIDIATNCKLPVPDSKAIVYYDNSQGAVPYEFTITVSQSEYQKLQGVTEMKILAADDTQVSLFETHVDKQQQSLLQQFGMPQDSDKTEDDAPLIESYEIGSTPITNFFPFQSGYYQVKLRKRTKFPKEVKAGNGSKKRTCSLILAFFVQNMPVFFLVVKRNIIIFSRQREANNYVTNTNVHNIPVAYTPQQYVHFLVDRLKICSVEEAKKSSQRPKGIAKHSHQLHHNHIGGANNAAIAAAIANSGSNNKDSFNNFKPRVISSSVFQYATVLPNGDVLLQASPPTSSPGGSSGSSSSPIQQQLNNLSPIQLQLGPNSPIQLVFTNSGNNNNGNTIQASATVSTSPMQTNVQNLHQQLQGAGSVYYEPLLDFVPQLNVRYAASVTNSPAVMQQQILAQQAQQTYGPSLVQQAQLHQYPSAPQGYMQQVPQQHQTMQNYLPQQIMGNNNMVAPQAAPFQQSQQQQQFMALPNQQASYMQQPHMLVQHQQQHVVPQQQMLIQQATVPQQSGYPHAQMQPNQMQPHNINIGPVTRIQRQVPAPVVAKSVSEVGSSQDLSAPQKPVWGEKTSPAPVADVASSIMKELENFLQETIHSDAPSSSLPGIVSLNAPSEEQELYSLFNMHAEEMEKNGVQVIADDDLIEISVENSCFGQSAADSSPEQQQVAIGGYVDYSTIVFLPKEQAQTIISERKRLLFGGVSSGQPSSVAEQQNSQQLLKNPEKLTCRVLEPGKACTVQVQINSQQVFSHEKLKQLVKQKLPGHENDFKESGVIIVTSVVFVKGSKQILLNRVHRKRYVIIHDVYDEDNSDDDSEDSYNETSEDAEANKKEDEEISKNFAQQLSISVK